jgi:hypothetical protein
VSAASPPRGLDFEFGVVSLGLGGAGSFQLGLWLGVVDGLVDPSLLDGGPVAAGGVGYLEPFPVGLDDPGHFLGRLCPFLLLGLAGFLGSVGVVPGLSFLPGALRGRSWRAALLRSLVVQVTPSGSCSSSSPA